MSTAPTETVKDRVYKAADDITTEGIKLTVESVRQRAGCGMGPAVKYLREWRDRREAQAVKTLPQDVLDDFIAMWARVETQAAAKHAAEREAWTADREAIFTEMRDVAAAHDNTERKNREIEERFAAAHEELITLRKQTEQMTADRDKHTAELARSATELDQLRTSVTKLREEARTAQIEVAELRGENKGLRTALEQLTPEDVDTRKK